MSRQEIWDRLEAPGERVERCGACGGVSSLVTDGDTEQLLERLIEYVGDRLALSDDLVEDLGDIVTALNAYRNDAYSPLCRCGEAEWGRYPSVRFGAGPTRRRRKLPAVELPKSKPGVFWLYRIWAHDDRLVYVGVTRNLQARMRRHRETYGEAVHRVTYEQHSSREAVLEAERIAIATEHPAFNLEGV